MDASKAGNVRLDLNNCSRSATLESEERKTLFGVAKGILEVEYLE